MNKLAIFLFALATSTFALATGSPEGNWRTIDDETGEAKSVVNIWIENDELKAKIVTLLNPSSPNPVCDLCKGERKDQPIEGMTFVWGLETKGDEWKGGTILDPAKGKEYKAKMALSEDGNTLEVRGFVGFALIGRTQVWERVQ